MLWRIDFTPMPFDAEVWRATRSEDSHDSVRLRMVDDFLATHTPVGKSREDIVVLLGEPDDTTYFSNFDLVYHLGLERDSAFPIDSEWLVMRLDRNGLVTEALLVTD